MSAHAGRRIQNALRRTVSLRDAVLQQIRARQASPSRSQQVPYSALQDFVFGKASNEDPLTLPFRLLLERFNPNRSVDFVDEFTNGSKKFKLSHSAPVPVPQEEGSTASVRDLLTRPEVVFSREMYQEFFELKAMVAEADLVDRMDQSPFVGSVRQEVQARLVQLNRDLCGLSIRLRGEDGLFKMWKKLCPRAKPQHLKMFEKWCREYDHLTERRSSLRVAKSASDTFHENGLKPLLPAADLRRIKDEFSRLDTHGNGLIEVSTLSDSLQLGDAFEVARMYDGNDDGYIDVSEFVRMMCPSEYRLPETDEIGRKLFGDLIEHETMSLESKYNEQAASFEKSAESSRHLSDATPGTLLPQVDEKTWDTWNATFDRLDMNPDAKVTLGEVIGSGFLSPEVSAFVYRVLAPEDGDGGEGFSREAFMAAMLRAHGMRRPHALSKQASPGQDH